MFVRSLVEFREKNPEGFAAFKEQSSRNLSRTFNNFDHKGSKNTPSLLQKSVFDDLCKKYSELVSQASGDKIQSTEEDGTISYKILNPSLEHRVKQIVFRVVEIACAELLDEKSGLLKPECVELLELESVDDKKTIAVISSFVQAVFQDITFTAATAYPKLFAQKGGEDIQIQSVINDLRREQLSNYIKNGQVFARETGAGLAEIGLLSQENLARFIRADLDSHKKSAEDHKAVIQFWIDVLLFLQSTAKNSLFHAVYSAFVLDSSASDIANIGQNKEFDSLQKHFGVLERARREAAAQSSEEKQVSEEKNNFETLSALLDYRDKAATINRLIDKYDAAKSFFRIRQDLELDILRLMRYDSAALKSPLLEILEEFQKGIPSGSLKEFILVESQAIKIAAAVPSPAATTVSVSASEESSTPSPQVSSTPPKPLSKTFPMDSSGSSEEPSTPSPHTSTFFKPDSSSASPTKPAAAKFDPTKVVRR